MDVTDSIVIDANSYTMYNTGTINAKGSYVGGAVGAVLEDVTTAGYTIYNTGEVTAETGNYVGGLFGLFDSISSLLSLCCKLGLTNAFNLFLLVCI